MFVRRDLNKLNDDHRFLYDNIVVVYINLDYDLFPCFVESVWPSIKMNFCAMQCNAESVQMFVQKIFEFIFSVKHVFSF